MRPSYKKPYYYINNVNADAEWYEAPLTPTNPTEWETETTGTDSVLTSGTDHGGVTKINYTENGEPIDITVADSIHENDRKISLSDINLPRYQK